MLIEPTILYLLLTLIFIREVIFLYTVNKLTNKIMARNYHDMVLSDNLTKKTKEKKFRVDDDMEEDLNPLAEIGI